MLNSYSIANALAQFDINIDGLTSVDLVNDSREVKTGSVFCAVIGSLQDGRKYIDQAINAGAVLIISECQHKQQHGNIITRDSTIVNAEKVNIIQFYQLNAHLTALAQYYYDQPLHKLKLIGVTGTNGKTSTSLITARLFELCGKSSAVIGTVGAGKLGALQAISNTTPGGTELSQLLAKFVEQDVEYAVMEVSSHALDQRRVTSDMLSVAAFTNLTRDHLDYHHTMEKYAAAKLSIFSNENQHAIVNGDDKTAEQWLENGEFDNKDVAVFGRNSKVTRYGKFFHATDIELTPNGLSFTVNSHAGSFAISSKLIGEFNIDNLLAAMAILDAQNIPMVDICNAISALMPINGRMEAYTNVNKATTVVDYAHTPDALENALIACRRHCQGDLWVVFGCGGDRDKGKRAIMGEIAEKFADHIVLTNDNPRNEQPEMIVNDILSGCKKREKITVMFDRKQAVTATIAHAQVNDVVLLAGKGHEETIQIANDVVFYSERNLVKSLYKQGLSNQPPLTGCAQ